MNIEISLIFCHTVENWDDKYAEFSNESWRAFKMLVLNMRMIHLKVFGVLEYFQNEKIYINFQICNQRVNIKPKFNQLSSLKMHRNFFVEQYRIFF